MHFYVSQNAQTTQCRQAGNYNSERAPLNNSHENLIQLRVSINCILSQFLICSFLFFFFNENSQIHLHHFSAIVFFQTSLPHFQREPIIDN